MDSVTESVRRQYEQFPYPGGDPLVRVANDARMLLSYVERGRNHKGTLHALDAGCGTGSGILGAAFCQPDVSFLGIDFSQASLELASAKARSQPQERSISAMQLADAGWTRRP